MRGAVRLWAVVFLTVLALTPIAAADLATPVEPLPPRRRASMFVPCANLDFSDRAEAYLKSYRDRLNPQTQMRVMSR
jgi:hypothetical protein